MKDITFSLLLILCFFVACKKDDPEPVGCLEASTDGTSESCDAIASSAIYCTVQDLGSYELEQASRDFLPDFCKEDVQNHTYRNFDGDVQILSVVQRTFFKSRAIFPSEAACPSDGARKTGYCLDFEEINYRMVNPDESVDLTISVYTKPDHRQQSGNNVGDFVEIIRGLDPNSIQLEFSTVINQRTLSFSETDNQEFYDTYNLNDIVFTDVFSNDITGIPVETFKYFYTKQDGLVGFSDENEEIWVLTK